MSYTIRDRIEGIEEILNAWKNDMFRHTVAMEKLGEKLSEVQCEVAELRKLVETKSKPE